MTRTLCVFSDGTGQRGVRVDAGASNVFKLYEWARTEPSQPCFYDPGVGAEPGRKLSWTRWGRNLVGKATGAGITRNIRDGYEFLLCNWDPPGGGSPAANRIAVFGFSRGAYTVRSLAAAITLCGIPARIQDGVDIGARTREAEALRLAILDEAIAIYQTAHGPEGAGERRRRAADFRRIYHCHDAPVHLVAVFDTVAALGLPGVMNLANPFRHIFHDHKLGASVPFGLQALSIDENRKVFAPVPWDESAASPGQVIEQVWFPGVHSDIGGGYADRGLSDLSLSWMLERCRRPDIGLRFDSGGYEFQASVTARQHDERTGMGVLWSRGDRTGKVLTASRDRDALCGEIETRFEAPELAYRPRPLGRHPRVGHYY